MATIELHVQDPHKPELPEDWRDHVEALLLSGATMHIYRLGDEVRIDMSKAPWHRRIAIHAFDFDDPSVNVIDCLGAMISSASASL